jgi:hypothetical protein
MILTPHLAELLDQSAIAASVRFGWPMPTTASRRSTSASSDDAAVPSPAVKATRPEPVHQLVLSFAD